MKTHQTFAIPYFSLGFLLLLLLLTIPACAQETATQIPGWGERLRGGGGTVVIQILLSVFAFGYALERLFHLRRKAIAPAGLAARADALWREGRYHDIEALAEREPSTLATILAYVARHRKAPLVDVSTICGDIASREIALHLQRAYPIAVVATLEPLLGLLGTVIGMIDAFDVVVLTGSLGDASLLAGGISKALVTTAVGLILAIPLLGLYHFFKNRTNLYAAMLEEEVTALLSEWLMPSTGRKDTEYSDAR